MPFSLVPKLVVSSERILEMKNKRWLVVAILALLISGTCFVLMEDFRRLYLVLAYEDGEGYMELIEENRRATTDVRIIQVAPRTDVRLKRVAWFPGSSRTLVDFKCHACLQGKHDKCAPTFSVVVGDLRGTQYLFHCLCDDGHAP